MYKFSNKSKQKMKGVHPDLIKVLNLAIQISKQDFSITEGVRSAEVQQSLYLSKKSQTLKSKHLIQEDGYGHAVDVVPYPISWNVEDFYEIAEAIRTAAKQLNIKIRWGGAWILLNNTDKSCEQLVKEYSVARRKAGNRVFIDAPHFEIIL